MKKLLLPFCILLLMLAGSLQNASAKVLRVFYFGTSVAGTDFATPQLAHDAAAAGDTIAIYPNAGLAGVVCIKRLVWLGVGYFIDGTGNAGLQSFTVPSALSFLNLGLGSDATVVSGLTLSTLTINGASANHLIKRNNITNALNFSANTTGVSVLQNYINSISSSGSFSTANVNISNNIILSTLTLTTGTNNGLLSNNVFTANAFSLGTFIVQNNISVTSAPVTCNSCTFLNNIGAGTQYPVGNGNLQNTVMANVFVGTGTSDAKWKLKVASPAIGAGQAGVDCGAYGGPDPYVLSGVPQIPSIYQLVAPGGTTVSGATMNVSISTRGN